MIKDKLTNAEVYYSLSNRVKAAFEWLKSADLVNIADGKYVLDGENLFANVQTYQTKEEAPYEAHREYIDIQYMIAGVERIGVTDYSNCIVKEEYNSEKDIEFLNCNKPELYQVINEGEFLLLYPHDSHKPSIDYNGKQSVKKVVVKVKI